MFDQSKRPWYFTWIILFMVPLPGIGIDLYTPSLPSIVHALHVSIALVKLTIPFYLLGYAIGPLLFGPLCDYYGRKKVLICGTVFYILSCIIIVFVGNIYVILAMRFIQGFMVAAIGIIYSVLVIDCYKPGIEIRRMSSMMPTVWALGPIIAPFVGGYLQHYFGWQANFVFFMVYAILILLVCIILPETLPKPIPFKIKTMLAGYRIIFSSKCFWGAIIYMGVVYALIVIFSIIGPFMLQNILHFTPVQFGHIALLMGLAFFIGGIINRGLIEKFSSRPLVFISLLIMLLTAFVILILGLYFPVNLYRFTIPIFIVLLFSAIVFPAGVSISLSLFREMAGLSSSARRFLFVSFTGVSTLLASFLTSKTQVPMALAYVVLIILCFFAYFFLAKQNES